MNLIAKYINLIGVALLLAVAGAAAGGSEGNSFTPTAGWITQLAEEMRTNNPALLASRARNHAASAQLGAVRTWEDPMLRAGAMSAEKMMREQDGDILYGVEQKLPLWGKPALARRVAQAELSVATADADYQFQTLRRELAKAVFETALVENTVTVGEQDLRWLEVSVQTAEGRYEAGQEKLMYVLQLQNERAKRIEQLQNDRADLDHARLALNRLLNRRSDSPWPVLGLPEVAAKVDYSSKLLELASRYEPKLQVMRQEIMVAQAMTESTRREKLPEVSLGAQGRNYSGSGELRQAELMVSFNLPLFNAGKYRNALRRDEAKLKAAELDTVDYELSLRQEIHQLTVKADAARREALLYRDQVVPRAEQARDSAQAMWESGNGMLRDLLDARRMLLEARLMYARAVTEQYLMLSELVLCCGLGDLEALTMLNIIPEVRNQETKP